MLNFPNLLLFSFFVFCSGLSFSHMASGNSQNNDSGSRLACIMQSNLPTNKQCRPPDEASVHSFTSESGKYSVNVNAWSSDSGGQDIYRACSERVSVRCQTGKKRDEFEGSQIQVSLSRSKQNDTGLFPPQSGGEPPKPEDNPGGGGVDPFDHQQSPTHMVVTVSLKDLEKNRRSTLRFPGPDRQHLPADQLIPLEVLPGQPDRYLIIAGDGKYSVLDEEGALLYSLLLAGGGSEDKIRNFVAALSAAREMQAEGLAQSGWEVPGDKTNRKRGSSWGGNVDQDSGYGAGAGGGSKRRAIAPLQQSYGSGGEGFEPPPHRGGNQGVVDMLLQQNPDISGALLAILVGDNPFADQYVGYTDQQYIAAIRDSLTPQIVILEGRIRNGEIQYNDWVTDPQIRQSEHVGMNPAGIPVSRYYLALMPRRSHFDVMQLAVNASQQNLISDVEFSSLIPSLTQESPVNQDRLFDRILTSNPEITWPQMHSLVGFVSPPDQAGAQNPHTVAVSGPARVPVGGGIVPAGGRELPNFLRKPSSAQPILIAQAHVTGQHEQAFSEDRRDKALKEVIEKFAASAAGTSDYQWSDLYPNLLRYIDSKEHDNFIVEYQGITTQGGGWADTLLKVASLLQKYGASLPDNNHPPALLVVRAFTVHREVSANAIKLADLMETAYRTVRVRYQRDLPAIDTIDVIPVMYSNTNLAHLAVNLLSEMTGRWLVTHEVSDDATALWAMLALTQELHTVGDVNERIKTMITAQKLKQLPANLFALFGYTDELGLSREAALVGLLRAVDSGHLEDTGLKQALMGLAGHVSREPSSNAMKASMYRLIADTLRQDLKLSGGVQSSHQQVEVAGAKPASAQPMNGEARKTLRIGDFSSVHSLLKKVEFPAVQYRQLGIYLGIKKNDIDTIEADNSWAKDRSWTILSEILAKWLKWNTEVGADKPSIEVLAKAVDKIDKSAGEQIRNKYADTTSAARSGVRGSYSINDLQRIISELDRYGVGASNWSKLGLALGLNYSVLRDIEADYRNVGDRRRYMLVKWLESGNVRNKGALAKALREANNIAAAEMIEQSTRL